MTTARLTVRVPEPLKQRVDERCDESGAPLNTFVRRAIEEKLDREQPASPKRRKARKAG